MHGILSSITNQKGRWQFSNKFGIVALDSNRDSGLFLYPSAMDPGRI